MRLLLTSSGISNPSINEALVDLLGKPISQCRALCIPTAIYPFPGGPYMAGDLLRGLVRNPLCDLGWKALGVLELTALPSIAKDVWAATVGEADALLVWGGDPLYLAHWLRESGLTELLGSLREESVYVGVSAGAIAATSTFGETYPEPPRGTGTPLTSEDIVFTTPAGDLHSTFVTAEGAGLVDFAVIPHLDNEQHADASLANAAIWAAKLPVPTYAIDDQTAIKVVDGTIDVVSEGHWELFSPKGYVAQGSRT
jgi:dipeptidase E